MNGGSASRLTVRKLTQVVGRFRQRTRLKTVDVQLTVLPVQPLGRAAAPSPGPRLGAGRSEGRHSSTHPVMR
jgi:hypothetical protein